MGWNKDGTVFTKKRTDLLGIIKKVTQKAEAEAKEEVRIAEEEKRQTEKLAANDR